MGHRQGILGVSREIRGRGLVVLGAALTATTPAVAQDRSAASEESSEIVVTATGRAESRDKVAGTIQIIGTEAIERSSARSVTDLLAESGGAFLSEWTPGQTSINIRGGASDGQGRDFKGQVLVLVNGRRAGTANVSKLSPSDIARIEVVRGPSSVVYGSQNIGGVINLITKNGRSAPGATLQFTTGSWDLYQGTAQAGGSAGALDYYVGFSIGGRDDYHAGKGGSRQINTAWKRYGGSAAIGYEFDELNRIDLSARTDGIYDAGFRGSAANYFAKEDRYNESADLVYTGGLPGDVVRWNAQLYGVRDVNNLRWASPVVRGSNGLPAAGTSKDYNRSVLKIFGSRFQPSLTLWEGNSLLLGWDWEWSQLRSTRYREGVNGASISQVAPLDNNQTEKVNALYFENAQTIWGDRLTARGGLRWTWGNTSFDPTPNLAGQITGDRNYKATTYAVGLTFKALPNLTFRTGVASGFRAPNATELAADFVTLGGGRTFGNPNLGPEKSQQIEFGANFRTGALGLDAAIFRNVIKDRIIAQARQNAVNVSDYVNNPDDVVIEGIEAQADLDLLKVTGANGGSWIAKLQGSGNYNFKMEDKGAAATANTRNVQRVYKYQASFGATVGQDGTEGRAWSLQIQGVLDGPVWYNTEEPLLIPFAEPNSNFIHRKSPYWIWGVKGRMDISEQLEAFVSVDNIFDKNEHAILMAIDKAPYLLDTRFANGGVGTSMPGRQFQVGVKLRFGS